jgi:hypothetical protein
MICRPNCLYFTAGVVHRRSKTTTPVGITTIRTQRPVSSDKDPSVIFIATAYTLWGHHILQNLSSVATQAKTHITFSKVQHRQFNSPQKDTAICQFLLAAHPLVCCYNISKCPSILKQQFSNTGWSKSICAPHDYSTNIRCTETFCLPCIFSTIVYSISGVKRDWAQCKILPWGL